MVKVSVVIPTYKRPQLLRRCLEALMEQRFDPGEFEIIVVDDGAGVPGNGHSFDKKGWSDTREVVERFYLNRLVKQPPPPDPFEVIDPVGGRLVPVLELVRLTKTQVVEHPMLPRIRYLANRGRRGPAAARNLGWRSAEGQIIAFTDDDCIPDRNWLKNGVAAMIEEGAAGAWGRVVVPLPAAPTDYEVDAAGLERAEFITANCFYRRRVLAEVGGFDERFQAAWREDSDLFFSVLEGKYPLVMVASAKVVHPVRQVPPGISLRQQKRNLYNALLYKKHPLLYRQRIQALPPLLYYAALIGLAVAGLGLASGNMTIVLAGLAAWLCSTVVFFWKRVQKTTHHLEHVIEMLVTSILIPPVAIYWRIRGAIRYRVLFL